MKVVLALTLWLGISASVLWWLQRNEVMAEDEVQTMVVGSLTFGAFAAGLVWSGFKALARRRTGAR